MCYKLTGIRAPHTRNTCPVAPTLLCRRCHCKGHTTAECGASWANWERPTSLEELIPADVRERWNIQTSTELMFETERGAPGTDRERKIEVEVSSNDKQLRQFMKENAIDTTSAREENLKRIRDWATQHGFRLRIV